ncbi:MAG: cohesin domain-containing protein, partial [Candidatus Stygibacter frigidus]|nr:cohesin domain-containing protein [Candidatus Stygibacter frigidus]
MKRKIFLILFIALTVAILQADLAGAGFVMSDVDQMGLAPFEFQVNSSDLLAEDQAISFQFHLNYDADLFVYTGYTTGADLPGMLVVNDLNPGIVNVAYADASVLEGINELITVHLTPVEPCETLFTMTEARYNNTDITNITGGNIVINGIPELAMTIEDVVHQGLTPFEVTVLSNDIAVEDGIISYQFEFELPYGTQYLDYSYDESLTGELVVNDTDPGILYVAYAGFDPISGVTDLLTVSVIAEEYGEYPFVAGTAAFNNFTLEDAAIGYATVYPAWDEIVIEADGADIFTGDQFTSYISTTPIMLENNIISAQGILNYDAEILQFVEVAGSDRLDEFVVNATEPGVIQIAYASSDPIDWSGPIIGFVFEAIDDGETELTISEFIYNNTYITNLVPGEVLITNPNDPPVAMAGSDVELLEGEAGMLDGSLSYDPNQDELTYLWTGDLLLDDDTAVNPNFTAPEVEENTDYVMTLTVDDGEFTATDEVVVTIINVPNPADAVISMENQDVTIDQEFAVNVYTTPLNADFGVISYQYILNYDPEILSYTGYSNGTGVPEGMLVVNDTEPGVLQVAFSNPDAITNPDYLTQFTFVGTVLDQAEISISEFYYNNTAVLNLQPAMIAVHVPYYFTGVYVEDEEAGINLEFTCDVMTEELMADWNVISYQFDLYYDTAMLEYTGNQLGDVPTGGNLLAYEATPGHLSVAYANFNALSGVGSIAGFNFIPLQLGSTDITIENFKYNTTYLPNVDGGTIDIIIPYSNAVISAPDLTVGGGETFTVGITTSNINVDWNVISFQFDLGFDPELLDYVGYSNGSIINSGNLLAFENADGNVSVAFADFAPIGGEGTLIELQFTAAMELDQSVLDIGNFKYNSLFLDDANINDGMVTIVQPYADAVITCQDAETREGLDFTVGISTTELQENWGLISFQFNLDFDPEMVEFTGYETGNVITSGNLLAYENAPGNITVAFADYMSLSGVGDLIVLEFTALLAGDTTLDLNEFKYNALYLDNMVDGNVFIDLGNYPPIADAGVDQVVNEGEEVTLNGTASYDPDDYLRTPDWDLNISDYEYNGFIWGVVVFNGVQVEDINDMIGVFVGEECRGIAQQSTNSVVDYTIPFGHTAFMPQVYSNLTGGEIMTFKYYDASADMIYDVEGELPFTSDMVVGGGWDPYIFSVTGEPTYDLIFNWLAPDGIILDDPASATPSFTAPWFDADTELVFGLEVSDGQAWSEVDEVVVTVIDHPIDEIVVSAPELTQNEDESFVVPISTTMIQPDMDIISYQFNLNFDPAVIQYDGYTAGALSPNMLVVYNVEPGLINVAYADNLPIVGEGELLAFQFTALEGGVSPLNLNNFKYNNVFVNMTNGSVEVIGVNDTPVFDLPPMLNFNEDEVHTFDFSEYIEDPDNDEHTITFFGNSQINISVLGYDVTMSAPTNWYGFEPVTFIVDDNSGRAAAVDVAVINVISVNDPPVLDVPPVMYFDEDGVMVFDIGMYSSDVDGDALVLYVDGMVNLNVEIDGLVATITGDPNWNGEEVLTFTVDDQQNRATAIDNCNFVVAPINDPPVLDLPETISFNEDEMLDFNVANYASDTDMDEINIISVEYDQADLDNSFEDMMIHFTAAADWYGITEVTVTITDN